MKKTVLTGLLMLAAFSVKAQQETVFTQDFEDIDSVEEQQWGALDVNGDEVTFGFIQSQPVLGQLGFTGNVMGTFNFNYDDENNPVVIEGSDDMLVSPFIELPDNENLSLSFRLCGIGTVEDAASGYQVYAINALEFADAQTMEDMIEIVDATTPIDEGMANGISFEVSYDLGAMQGETILVFVRQSGSTGPAYLFVDDMTVTSGLLATEPAITAAFSVYPNPTADFIRVENNLGIALQGITVTDANGRTVKTLACNGAENTTADLTDLSAGTYFVNIATDRGTVMKRVIRK